MGNAPSVQNPSHIRIYKDLLRIQNPATRVEMIRTLLVGQEYLASARSSGVYSHLLAYIARVEAGQRPAALPGEMAMTSVSQPPALRQQQLVRLVRDHDVPLRLAHLLQTMRHRNGVAVVAPGTGASAARHGIPSFVRPLD
jgi:PP-loop superfamily ATP-utilizing enzyme